ncbi:1-phosphofructokinase family hexose kinase [Agromyces protaetiae]|uniref:1-phosphofructokinase family hexose kinase n=1 Tax=Agromyces protaetiae TaxID=2509455 RepID=A0A4V0YH28_9MICO|nr:hexose kinase [Agromyces protaetiae]QAY73261.1 1-phosphofructokinase family hexose kinase [Agromyces protaetiae]
MILTVTPNPALDLTWHVDRLAPGETHRVDTGHGRAGGKGLNVARVLHAEGREVTALATVGGASGHEFAAEAAASGIPTRLLPVAGSTRRSIAIVDRRSGEATVLNERGAALAAHEASALLAEAATLGGRARAVAISGSLPPGLHADAIGELVATLTAHGVPVVADVPGAALLAAARAGAAAVKPNRDELVEATGEHDPLAGARRLQALGARIVVASLGADGMLVLDPEGRALRARLGRTLHGNATGAGDAAVAAIALALAEASDASEAPDLESLARRAAAWSASAVLMPLAGELHPDHAALAREIAIDDDIDTDATEPE